MIVGLVDICAAFIFLLVAVVRRAEARDYMWAMLFGEMGSAFVVNALMPDGMARVGTALFFFVAVVSTCVLWWQLRKRSQFRVRGPGSAP